ncbi:MAG: hypothetical protein H6737_16560 [Alphaproteobacteria bacterium]|nr:hypothetical protein [Alphaproteobacteria bacterium]
MIALALLGCHAHLRYEPVAFEVPPLAFDHPMLVGAVRTHLDSGRIPSLARHSPEGPVPLGPDAVASLSDTELYAVFATSGRWSRGAELDLLVPTSRGPEAVSVWVDPGGRVEVAAGTVQPVEPLPPTHVDEARWEREIAEAYDLEGFSGPWSLRELGFVSIALEGLAPNEREALTGVRLARIARSPRRAAEMAWYGPSEVPPRLEVYDAAFDEFGHGFVGPLDRPVPTPVMTLMHEFGHAVVDRPLRDTFEAWRTALEASERMVDPTSFQAAFDRAHELERCYHRLGNDGPVIEAYEAVRGRTRGPTTYGWRSRSHESFAEAFALHHLDPAALRRVMPDVADWFDSDEHVRTGLSGGGCLRPTSP